MDYKSFRKILSYDANKDVSLRVEEAHYLDANSVNANKDIQKGKTITEDTVDFLKYFDFIDLSGVDGRITGLADYKYFLAIAPNGTTFLLQDMH